MILFCINSDIYIVNDIGLHIWSMVVEWYTIIADVLIKSRYIEEYENHLYNNGGNSTVGLPGVEKNTK